MFVGLVAGFALIPGWSTLWPTLSNDWQEWMSAGAGLPEGVSLVATPLPTLVRIESSETPQPISSGASSTSAADTETSADPGDILTPTPTAPADLSTSAAVRGTENMVYIPGGSFQMGSTLSSNARPVHAVSLSPFYIDKTEVTNQQWQSCVEAGSCDPPQVLSDIDGQPYYSEPAYGEHPVVNITWHQAAAFCEWRDARLPTEAEWEMATRWDDANQVSTAYPWGDEWHSENANYCDPSCPLASRSSTSYDDGYPLTAPVGSFPDGVSHFGVLDMAGNVAEWTADLYQPDYYSVSPTDNPAGPETGAFRVVRGGAWGVNPANLQSAIRSAYSPGVFGPGVGLRCAVSSQPGN